MNNKQNLAQILFLGVAFVLAITALTLALREEAFAGPICPNSACAPTCSIGSSTQCVSTGVLCDGHSGNPATCAEYCAWSAQE